MYHTFPIPFVHLLCLYKTICCKMHYFSFLDSIVRVLLNLKISDYKKVNRLVNYKSNVNITNMSTWNCDTVLLFLAMRKWLFQHPWDEIGKFKNVFGCILRNSDPKNDHILVKTSSVNNWNSCKDFVAYGYIEWWVKHIWKSCLGFIKQQKDANVV